MHNDGINMRAQRKETNTEKMIRKAKCLMVRNEEIKSTVKPMITEKALMVIPLPVVVMVVVIAFLYVFPCLSSFL